MLPFLVAGLLDPALGLLSAHPHAGSQRASFCLHAGNQRASFKMKAEAASGNAHVLLSTFGSAATPEATKSAALKELQSLDSDARSALIDAVLEHLDATPPLARRRWLVRLPSRRLRNGAFLRLLTAMSAEASAEEAALRRRRSLISLLRQCVSARGVHAVERERRRRVSRATTMAEMLTRTPQGLETPDYKVVAEFNTEVSWEVRRYDDFAVVTTDSTRGVAETGTADAAPLQTPSMPRAGAFQALAGYIFGGNQADKKMAMTTPVLSYTDSSGGRRMAFVLPSDYWGQPAGAEADEPPAPLEGSGVKLALDKGGGLLERSDLQAVTWFDGFAGEAEVARRKALLIDALRTQDCPYEPLGNTLGVDEPPFALLQYNDPFTPPWLRRNELALPVRPRAASAT